MSELLKQVSLGQVVITANAKDQLSLQDVSTGLSRHVVGDWGDIDKEDWQANNDALEQGSRLLSVYHDSSGVKYWVISEHDRSVTTVLLPEDY